MTTPTTVTVTVTENKVVVQSPYDKAFVDRAHDLNGDFKRANRTWMFDRRDEQRVREALVDIYGTDGTNDTETTVVTVRMPVTEPRARDEQHEFRVAGRQLVWRPGRDDEVRYGAGVVLIAGGFESRGGSVRYPTLSPVGTPVIEVRDVPINAAQRMVDAVAGAQIISDAQVQREALAAEREALVARLAEIDARLVELI